MTKEHHDYLRRLPPEFYRGRAYVHWSMTVAGRKAGWMICYWGRFWRLYSRLCHHGLLVCDVDSGEADG